MPTMRGWRVAVLATTAGLAMSAPLAAHAAPFKGFDVTGSENEPLGTNVPGDQEGVELSGLDLGDPQSSVRIAWGDGETSTCLFETAPPTSNPAPACWFWDGEADVSAGGIFGAHAYAAPDEDSSGVDVPYTWKVTAPGEAITGTATIADAPLAVIAGYAGGGPPPITALAGIAEPTEVAVFRDADPDPQLSNYEVSIDWGDGTPATPGTVAVGASGGRFVVTGAHAYATAGTYTITTLITDQIAGHVGYGPVTATTPATVSSAGVESLTAQEGTPVSGVIAQFCDESGLPGSVAVDWGDATPADPDATVTPTSAGCDTVSAAHTYAEGGSYTVTVTPAPATWAAPVAGTATVTDAPLTATFDTATVAAAGSSFTLPATPLATIGDANPDAPPCTGGACDVTATIAWGDGSDSPAAIAPGTGGLVASGSHVYGAPGQYTITVSAVDVHGASAVATGTYTVAPPPVAKSGCLSPVPAVGATAGRFGVALAPGAPNWGVSSDDRVVRFGNVVACAIDAPWTYEGAPLQGSGTGSGSGSGPHALVPGLFQATGRIIVNGIELQPDTGATPFT